MPEDDIQNRVASIRKSLAASGEKWGRPVQIIAVTKTQSADRINQLLDAHVLDIGENRVQEWMEKQAGVDPAFRLHIIGRLQSNKVKYIIDRACLIHSLDRASLAEEISRRAAERGRRMPVLVEVNIGGEESKGGLAPADVPAFVRTYAGAPGIQISGLMTVLPMSSPPHDIRSLCREMRGLFDRLSSEGIPGAQMRHLSMGMSGDYEVAAEEGATMVRIGSAIFGRRA